MSEYYQLNAEAYFSSTFEVDPSSFLEPLAGRLDPGATILDIGCGSGRDLLWLKKRGFNPTGLERAPKLVKLAEENTGCSVMESDFLNFEFSNYNFDALLSVGAFVHLDIDQLPPLLSSIGQALKENGYLYLTLKEGEGKQSSPDGRVFTLWSTPALEEIFARQHLRIIDFSRQISKIRQSDVWLGYLLQKTG